VDVSGEEELREERRTLWWKNKTKHDAEQQTDPVHQGYSTSVASGPNKKITGGVRAAQGGGVLVRGGGGE